MDIRSVLPSQLISENGGDFVVINFGSANLRVGHATALSPVVIPHCIAHQLSGRTAPDQGTKGSIPEQGFSTSPVSDARKIERDEICQMVELQLKMNPFVPEQDEPPKDNIEGWISIQLNEEESFPWTRVLTENPAFQGHSPAAEPIVDTVGTLGDDHLPTVTPHSTQVSEVVDSHEFEAKAVEESSQRVPEEFAQVHEEPQQIFEDSQEILPEESKVSSSMKSNVDIVEDSEGETREEKREEIAPDTDDEAGKEPSGRTLQDSENETRKETEAAIREVQEERSPVVVANGSPMEPKEDVHDGSDVEIHVEVRLESTDTTNSNLPVGREKGVENPFKYRKYICGAEAMNISAQEPYILRRPICRGHLNVNQQYSLQQVCDDLYSIWDWVLTEKLSLGSESRQQLSAVLVVPDTMDNREIKEVLSIVLRDLRFRSAVIHQECVAATFGNGISSACVVNMGAQITSVVCVEDGVVLPTTRIVLPFGGEDISRCLLWVQQRWKSWAPLDTNPLLDPLDLQILEHLKESYCLIYEGDQSAVAEIPYHEKGKPTVVYKGSLTALNVPVMGLFYPSLLAPEECVAPLRPGFHSDHEDVLDDSVHVDTSKKSETELAPPPVPNGGASSVVGSTEMAIDETTESQGSAPDESALGLSRAIVNSILSIGRPDLQKKLFASIQLVGGTANTRGLVDAVEERVLHDIPADEAVDTVAVLQNRTDGPSACWKGGGVLGILDFARDQWVQQDEWVTGGVRRGCGRKYKDSCTLHSQAFYYSAIVD